MSNNALRDDSLRVGKKFAVRKPRYIPWILCTMRGITEVIGARASNSSGGQGGGISRNEALYAFAARFSASASTSRRS